MNKFFFICASIIICLVSACDKKSESSLNEIILSPTENVAPVFESGGGRVTISFYVPAPWTATVTYTGTEEGWISINPNRGEAGDQVVTLSATPNTLYSERKATVIISCKNARKEITVMQKALDEGDTSLSVNFDRISLDACGDVFSIKTFGYADFTVECMEDWCHVRKKTCDAYNSLEIEVEPNEADTRLSNIILKSKSGKNIHSIQVQQLSKAEQEATEVIESSTRSSLFLMFTATWCPYSPNMEAGLNLASSTWDQNMETVKVHVSNSDLYCLPSVELSSFYENNTTPTGILDGRIKIRNVGASNIVSQSILNALTEGKSLNLQGAALAGSASMENGEVCVNIRLDDLKEGTYALQTWLLEDDIIAGQEDATNECYHEAYIHNSVLRESLSLVLGDEFTVEEESSKYKEVSYNYKVPEYCNKDNIRILIILQRSVEANGTTFCFPFYVDNCISVPVGDCMGGGGNENIIPGEDIDID